VSIAGATPRPGQDKLRGVEAARGFAACLVVAVHAGNHMLKDSGVLPLVGMTLFGHAGVDLFFVISGFIILHVHRADIGRPDRVVPYLKRRIARIYPLYWFTLLATILLALRHGPVDPWQVATDLLLLPTATQIVDVSWTLQSEMLFYALFAVLILDRRLGMLLFAAWFLAIAATMLALPRAEEGAWGRILSKFNILFLFGLGVAQAARGRVPLPGLLAVAGGFGFLGFGLLENLRLVDGHGVLARFAYGLPSAALLLGLIALERQGRLAVPQWLVTLGDATYAIYLLHVFAVGAAWQVLKRSGLRELLPDDVLTLLLIGAGIVGGLVGTRLIEKPLNGLMRRLLAMAPAQPARARG
jgi:peptidoglycan/LPS O-acetylase OafA/YrhL